MKKTEVEAVREVFRKFNRNAGVLKTDPYGLDVSLTQGSALVELYHFKKLRPNDLVKLLNLEKSSISRMIEGLVNKDFVSVNTDPADRRAKLLSLTKRGQKIAVHINSLADQSVLQALEKLGPGDRNEIVAAFKKLGSVLTIS